MEVRPHGTLCSPAAVDRAIVANAFFMICCWGAGLPRSSWLGVGYDKTPRDDCHRGD